MVDPKDRRTPAPGERVVPSALTESDRPPPSEPPIPDEPSDTLNRRPPIVRVVSPKQLPPDRRPIPAGPTPTQTQPTQAAPIPEAATEPEGQIASMAPRIPDADTERNPAPPPDAITAPAPPAAIPTMIMDEASARAMPGTGVGTNLAGAALPSATFVRDALGSPAGSPPVSDLSLTPPPARTMPRFPSDVLPGPEARKLGVPAAASVATVPNDTTTLGKLNADLELAPMNRSSQAPFEPARLPSSAILGAPEVSSTPEAEDDTIPLPGDIAKMPPTKAREPSANVIVRAYVEGGALSGLVAVSDAVPNKPGFGASPISNAETQAGSGPVPVAPAAQKGAIRALIDLKQPRPGMPPAKPRIPSEHTQLEEAEAGAVDAAMQALEAKFARAGQETVDASELSESDLAAQLKAVATKLPSQEGVAQETIDSPFERQIPPLQETAPFAAPAPKIDTDAETPIAEPPAPPPAKDPDTRTGLVILAAGFLAFVLILLSHFLGVW